jgi:hypothetical protein
MPIVPDDLLRVAARVVSGALAAAAIVLGLIYALRLHQDAQARAAGREACVASGRDAAFCDEAMGRLHADCFARAGVPHSRYAKNDAVVRGDDYVRCLELGPDAFDDARAAARRAAPPRLR